MTLNTIICGDTLTELKKLPDESIDCVITSPPYYGLRDYDVEGQLGLEKTLDEYLEKILLITAELKRVLKKTGTMWWNHGDSYGTGSGSGIRNGKQATNRGTQTNENWQKSGKEKVIGYEKSLLLQNYRLIQRMIDKQQWILRNIIIWHKPNCMPSSVKDRFTVDFEPVFFLTKSKKYWFETQYEANTEISIKRADYENRRKEPSSIGTKSDSYGMPARFVKLNPQGHNKRCVWKINTQPFKGSHFAVFPEKLIEPMILAGCPKEICKKCGKARERISRHTDTFQKDNENKPPIIDESKIGGRIRRLSGATYKPQTEMTNELTDCHCNAGWDKGIVLDPFMGSGTTAVVAKKLGRDFLGIELNPAYVKMAEERIKAISNPLF